MCVYRKVDPEGLRTKGVITKVDRCVHFQADKDKLLSVLQNKALPLKKGYVPVVNRSADDLKVRKHASTLSLIHI